MEQTAPKILALSFENSPSQLYLASDKPLATSTIDFIVNGVASDVSTETLMDRTITGDSYPLPDGSRWTGTSYVYRLKLDKSLDDIVGSGNFNIKVVAQDGSEEVSPDLFYSQGSYPKI